MLVSYKILPRVAIHLNQANVFDKRPKGQKLGYLDHSCTLGICTAFVRLLGNFRTPVAPHLFRTYFVHKLPLFQIYWIIHFVTGIDIQVKWNRDIILLKYRKIVVYTCNVPFTWLQLLF